MTKGFGLVGIVAMALAIAGCGDSDVHVTTEPGVVPSAGVFTGSLNDGGSIRLVVGSIEAVSFDCDNERIQEAFDPPRSIEPDGTFNVKFNDGGRDFRVHGTFRDNDTVDGTIDDEDNHCDVSYDASRVGPITLTATPERTPTANVRTSTPNDGFTATPGPTSSGGPTSTGPTSTGPISGLTPTPKPTSTAITGGSCEGPHMSVTITSSAGSDLDTGWTGIAHDAVSIREAKVTAKLDCPDGSNCTVDGAALVGTNFGSPLPLSAGGVSSCVINTFREAVTGTYNCTSGCSESSAKLLSKVFLVLDPDKPCPPCVGDATPNDGVKGGHCDGGKTPGAACDVGGISDLFQNAGGAPPDAGRTSNDCEPSGSPVGSLNIDLNPLTTGTVTVNASVDCLSGSFPAGSCYCTGQVQPNACNPDGVCPESGVCENNVPDGVCSGQTFRQCDLNAGDTDCEGTFPGAGNCEAQPRPCFGNSISRTGQCGKSTGVLAAIFCIPKTSAAAINTVAGLPGPGAVTLPGAQVRTVIP